MPNQFAYNPRARRYRDIETGKFVSAKAVRSAVDQVIDVESGKLRELASKFTQGKISFAEWQLQSMAQIKALHVSMALAANGGINSTSPSDLGYIGNLIKQQYQFFRNMAKDIRQGRQALDGTLLARVGLYAQSARRTYEQVVKRAAKNGGAEEERRLLGAADHCAACAGEARKSWQAIGTLLMIGDTPCRGNCRCRFDYR